MIVRIIFSVMLIGFYLLLSALFNPAATLITGQAAGAQMLPSDMAYVKSALTIRAFSFSQEIGLALLAVALFSIWLKPTISLIKKLVELLVIVLAIVALYPMDKAFAFAETSEKAEAYTIMPNESAFWIPDVGNNKDNQVQMESEEYLKQNKVSAKRFPIPHAKFVNSGGWAGWDLYVPTGRLIIQDRTTFSHEWVDSHDRGTSAAKEGFPCQSKEGLNITVGISVGANVLEQNAAKFLYNFGVVPPKGNRNDPQVIFTSVYYGRSVADVMGDIGRKKIQGLICAEITSRTFDKANEDANLIMETVKKKATEYFESVGITLQFIGYADTFTFDKEVQDAINHKYVANTLNAQLDVLRAIAQLDVQRGLGKGLGEKGLPIVVTPDMINALIGLVKAPPAAEHAMPNGR